MEKCKDFKDFIGHLFKYSTKIIKISLGLAFLILTFWSSFLYNTKIIKINFGSPFL